MPDTNNHSASAGVEPATGRPAHIVNGQSRKGNHDRLEVRSLESVPSRSSTAEPTEARRPPGITPDGLQSRKDTNKATCGHPQFALTIHIKRRADIEQMFGVSHQPTCDAASSNPPATTRHLPEPRRSQPCSLPDRNSHSTCLRDTRRPMTLESHDANSAGLPSTVRERASRHRTDSHRPSSRTVPLSAGRTPCRRPRSHEDRARASCRRGR